MNLNFRVISKLVLILVIIGFIMPVACDRNGFQLADSMMDGDRDFEGLLMYLLFASAVIGVIIGLLLLMKKGMNPTIDWLIIAVCIASGLIVYFRLFKDAKLDNGAYVILAGWIGAFVFQILSFLKKE